MKGKKETLKLYQGDCLEKLKEIEDNSIDLVITDPPYIFKNNAGGGAFGSKKKKYHGQLKPISKGFNFELLKVLEQKLKKMNLYIFANKNLFFDLIAYYHSSNYNMDVLFWSKTNPVPACGNKYLSDTEYVLFIREKGVKVFGEYGTKRKYFISSTNKEDKKLYSHPTCKPVELLKRYIINSSRENEIVLDPFMGSGSTGAACLELNRKFVGIELDEQHFNTAKNRLKRK